MRRHNVLLICLLLTLPMLAGCTGNANGAGEADPISDASTVNINYYNNTTNTNTYTSTMPLVTSVLWDVNNSSPATITTQAGQVIEILDVWADDANAQGSIIVGGSDEFYGNGTMEDYSTVNASVSCASFSAYLDGVGYSGTIADEQPDFLPTDGGSCTYEFKGVQNVYQYTSKVVIMYRIHG